MNIFEQKKLDGWSSMAVVKPMEKFDMSVYSESFRFICSECCRTHGKYTGGVTANMKQEQICGWCNEKRNCVAPQFAGWPNDLKEPEFKQSGTIPGKFTVL
jgi:hypothetical protein